MGNIDSERDWGHAKDYVYGMWLMLQQDKPEDYCLSTGEYYSIRQIVEYAFSLRGFNIKWKGEGVEEKGIDNETGKVLIEVNKEYFRPAEVEELLGDSTKARTELGWETKYNFYDLIKDMVDNDCPQ